MVRSTAIARTGVCIVRVEQQAAGVLYTVRTVPDIVSAGDDVHAVVRLDQAVALVEQFLAAFTRGR